MTKNTEKPIEVTTYHSVALTPEQVKALCRNVNSFIRPDRHPTQGEVEENCKRLGLPVPVSWYFPVLPKAG